MVTINDKLWFIAVESNYSCCDIASKGSFRAFKVMCSFTGVAEKTGKYSADEWTVCR